MESNVEEQWGWAVETLLGCEVEEKRKCTADAVLTIKIGRAVRAKGKFLRGDTLANVIKVVD